MEIGQKLCIKLKVQNSQTHWISQIWKNLKGSEGTCGIPSQIGLSYAKILTILSLYMLINVVLIKKECSQDPRWHQTYFCGRRMINANPLPPPTKKKKNPKKLLLLRALKQTSKFICKYNLLFYHFFFKTLDEP